MIHSLACSCRLNGINTFEYFKVRVTRRRMQNWEIRDQWLSDEAYENWYDVTVDMSNSNGKHNRVFVLNIGHEPGIEFDKDIVYYLSNIRFSKEP